ncbi:MAG: hypothetical protein VKK04_10085 [Synechococcales bacterium]|nr:hypothetical protein [Synechococcales bacterium]
MATPQKPGRPHDQQNDQWQQDLNPNPGAGQNIGPSGEQPGRFHRTARDIKDLHDRLGSFSTDELEQIPVLEPGTRLEQGATYLNLNDPGRQEFTAMGDMVVEATNYLVPKSEVGYVLWNRLRGVDNPDRLAESRES